MLRDASHKQVIQKFSFIESLNLSRGIDQADQKGLDEIHTGQVAKTKEQAQEKLPNKRDLAATAAARKKVEASAIVASSDAASTINANWYESDSNPYGLNLSEIIKYSPSENLTDNYSQPNPNYLGKIVFALACSYCLFSLWWLFGHQGSKVLTMVTGGKQITLSKSDAEFIDYIERSLDSIDRQVEASKVNSDQENVVYVPVYTPNPATPSIPQVSNGNLPLTALPSTDAPKIPEPVAIAQPSPISPSEALKIPAPPPLPAPTPLGETNSPQVTETIATAISEPSVKHTLIGILELEENKSAALVKAKGQTRRVWIGEEINGSGWILDSVTNQTAKISSQGQVRSIAVGETF